MEKELERITGLLDAAKSEHVLAKQLLDDAVDRFNRAWWKRHDLEKELESYYAKKPVIEQRANSDGGEQGEGR